jgi:hypothetical protein
MRTTIIEKGILNIKWNAGLIERNEKIPARKQSKFLRMRLTKDSHPVSVA